MTTNRNSLNNYELSFSTKVGYLGSRIDYYTVLLLHTSLTSLYLQGRCTKESAIVVKEIIREHIFQVQDTLFHCVRRVWGSWNHTIQVS